MILSIVTPSWLPTTERLRTWSVAGRVMLIAACVAWVLSPLDGDFIPFLGWIDDFYAIRLALRAVASFFPDNPALQVASAPENTDPESGRKNCRVIGGEGRAR